MVYLSGNAASHVRLMVLVIRVAVSVVLTDAETGPTEGRGTFSSHVTEEKLLARDLIRHYEENVTSYGRPVLNTSKPLVITVAVHLIQIMSLNEETQALTTSIKADYKWRDEYTMWVPHEYGGITSLRLPAIKIWVPDMIVSNANDKPDKIEDSMLRVHFNGQVVWIQRNVYHTSCQVDMRMYPFDVQTCQLVIRSAGFLPSEIELRWEVEFDRNLLDCDECNVIDEYIEASEWSLTELRYQSNGGKYHARDQLQFTIVFQRKIVFFTYLLLLPCAVLTALTLVNFWLPPERPDKTSLAMSIFGSFMLLLLVLVGSIPSTASNVPILGIYYFFNMIITATSIFLAACVVNLSRANRSKKRVPKWLRLITIDTLGGIFGVSIPHSKVKEISKRKKLMKQLSRQQTVESEANELMAYPATPDNYLRIEELRQRSSIGDSNSEQPSAAVVRTDKDCLDLLRNIANVVLHLKSAVDEVKIHILNKDKMLQMRDEKALEWHCVAVTLDRLFFFIYLAAIIILTIVSAAILLPRVQQLNAL